MYRPTVSQLAGCRRLCNSGSRYARVFEWEGMAVKLYKPKEYGDGTFSDPTILLANTLEGNKRLENAEVSVMPILDSWVDDGNNVFIVQPLATEVRWDAKLWEQGKNLALAAYDAGVGDVISCDIMWHEGKLVIVDCEEIFDADWDDHYGQDLAEMWGGF